MGKIQPIKIVAPELENVEKSKAEEIKKTFLPMSEMLAVFEEEFRKVKSESKKGITPELMAKSKRLRLDISKVRIETDKLHKKEKQKYLLAGRAIDGVRNILKWAIQEKEEFLKEIETHYERIEEEKRQKRLETRISELSLYTDEPSTLGLADMDEEVYQAYLKSCKDKFEAHMLELKKAEEKAKREEELRRLQTSRLNHIYDMGYGDYLDPDQRHALATFSDQEYNDLLDDLKCLSDEYKARVEAIKKENYRMVKENERLREAKEKEQAKLLAEVKKREAETLAERKKVLELEKAAKEKEEKEKRETEVKEEEAWKKRDSYKMKLLKEELTQITEKYNFKSKLNKAKFAKVCELINTQLKVLDVR